MEEKENRLFDLALRLYPCGCCNIQEVRHMVDTCQAYMSRVRDRLLWLRGFGDVKSVDLKEFARLFFNDNLESFVRSLDDHDRVG